MGESSSKTVREIEEIRERIDDEVRELESRMPAPARLTKKVAGAMLAGGTTGSLAWMIVRKARGRKKKLENAPDLPAQLSEKFKSLMKDGSWRLWVMGELAVLLLLRMRGTRRMKRMLRLLADRT